MTKQLLFKSITISNNYPLDYPIGLLVKNDCLWVVNKNNGLLVSYDLKGKLLSNRAHIHGTLNNLGIPTAICDNTNKKAFTFCFKQQTTCTDIIVCTENGTVNGYNLSINRCFVLIDNSRKNRVYTGLTTVQWNSETYLYLVDFYHHQIETYNSQLKLVSCVFKDMDNQEPLPVDCAPRTIIALAGLLYVIYVKINLLNTEHFINDSQYINIYEPNGRFVRRLAKITLFQIHHLILAPDNFGYPKNSIIVIGDNGCFNVLNEEGNLMDPFKGANKEFLLIEGLTNVAYNSNKNGLYWAAFVNKQSTIGYLSGVVSQ